MGFDSLLYFLVVLEVYLLLSCHIFMLRFANNGCQIGCLNSKTLIFQSLFLRQGYQVW